MKVGNLVKTSMGNIALILAINWEDNCYDVQFVSTNIVRTGFPMYKVKEVISESR